MYQSTTTFLFDAFIILNIYVQYVTCDYLIIVFHMYLQLLVYMQYYMKDGVPRKVELIFLVKQTGKNDGLD